MSYQIDYRSFSGIFAVPTSVKPLLRSCGGDALKVLLSILSAPEEPITVSRLSGELGFPPDDVEEALTYWAKNGILSRHEKFAQETLEQLTVSPSFPAPAPQPKVRKVTTKKSLSMPEISQLSQNDPNIPALLEESQNLLGRALSSPEIETLCSLYSYDGLAPEYLLLALMYCVQRGKTSFRYLEKLIASMLEKDIDTYDKAEKYLAGETQKESNEGAVRSAFGIYDRSLTAQEKKYIGVWFDEFRFDIAMVKLAYERTIDNIGKLSFPYINSILTSWHNKGITTAKEASLETMAQKKNSAADGKSGSTASSIDMEELQRMITFGKQSF